MTTADREENLPRLRKPAPGRLHPDTVKLLRTGFLIFGTGALSALLMLTVLGGVSRQGPHTNGGWLCLMIAMGCLPTGTLTLLLALLKVTSDRRG